MACVKGMLSTLILNIFLNFEQVSLNQRTEFKFVPENLWQEEAPAFQQLFCEVLSHVFFSQMFAVN